MPMVSLRRWLCHLRSAECILDLDPASAQFRRVRGLLIRQRRPDDLRGAHRLVEGPNGIG